jgi:choice-of-anchor B domain-containing protein
MKIRITLLITLITLFCKGQTLCTNGFAGVYPCDKVDLLARMDFPAIGGNNNTEGNDCWGWTDPLNGKEYAIMGCTSHTAFIDITNPTSPIYLGKVNSHNNVNSLWRDIEVYNNHAFIVSEANGHGMQVFDLTRLRNVTTPQVFEPDTRYSQFGNCHTIAINTTTGFAYCMGTGTYSGGPHVVNIQNPLNPTFAMGYSPEGYTHDAQIVTYAGPDAEHNGKEIYLGCNEDRVIILDVTNKANPILLSTFYYPNTAYTHQGWLTEDQKYYIVGDEIDENDFGFNTRTIVIDLSDLDNPITHFDYYGPTAAIDHNGYVKGNIFHLSNYRAGYRAINISQIQSGSMTEVGFFDTYPSNNNAQFNGVWSTYPYFSSGTIVVADIDRGMFLLRLDPSLSTQNQEKKSFAMVPNPAKTSVVIQSDNSFNKVVITDFLGKVVFQTEASTTNEFNIDVTQFQTGMYFVKVDDFNVEKLVIE